MRNQEKGSVFVESLLTISILSILAISLMSFGVFIFEKRIHEYKLFTKARNSLNGEHHSPSKIVKVKNKFSSVELHH